MLGYLDPNRRQTRNAPPYPGQVITILFSAANNTYADENGWLWLPVQGQSIGSPSSGASVADNKLLRLYTALWSVTSLTVNGGRGASSAADWSANKSLLLPDARGRSLVVAGQGSGLANRSIGSLFGAESQALTASQLPTTHSMSGNTNSDGVHAHTSTSATGGSHSHTGTSNSVNAVHNHTLTVDIVNNARGTGSGNVMTNLTTDSSPLGRTIADGAATHSHTISTDTAVAHSHTITVDNSLGHQHAFTLNLGGGGQSFSIVQPSLALTLLVASGELA